MNYQLLDQFEATFAGKAYLHRNSTLGDSIALRLYEDLLVLGRSAAYSRRVNSRLSAVNRQNKRQGVKARRGDGSFGEVVPNEIALREPGFQVPRAPIATIEIGVEVKILAKAMIKQIDRVVHDLTGQVDHFKSKGGQPITIGIVGINHAPFTTGYEGTRAFKTDGKVHKHPIDEAAEAERRLRARAEPAFSEFPVLHYIATNEPPFAFQWVNKKQTEQDYGAALVRISQTYQRLYGP